LGVRFLLDKNIRLIQALFILILLGLFFTSCRGNRDTKSTARVEAESAEVKALREKYALQLGVEAEALKRQAALLRFVDEWYGVPYKYGGKDKNGIDCSAFSSLLLLNVYGITAGGSAQGMYEQCKTVEVAELKEGDLVFFKIESKKVSHVGVYLMNNKFIHATTRKGVMINDLNETYYKKYFFAGGKLKTTAAANK
jgi:cell wall-associated NlpC family hydrolase